MNEYFAVLKFKEILFVCDEEMANCLSKEIITEMDISSKINILSDSKEALHYMSINEVDLLLLDLPTLIMDGFEFLDKLTNLKISSALKVIILTTSSNSADMEKFRSRKFDGFIVKPLTSQKLFEIIKML